MQNATRREGKSRRQHAFNWLSDEWAGADLGKEGSKSGFGFDRSDRPDDGLNCHGILFPVKPCDVWAATSKKFICRSLTRSGSLSCELRACLFECVHVEQTSPLSSEEGRREGSRRKVGWVITSHHRRESLGRSRLHSSAPGCLALHNLTLQPA